MQFYRIHPNPKKNAKSIPDYALKVNVREGYQILSDIGHLLSIGWPGQCKPYNINHPKTRSLCENRDVLSLFIKQYLACCEEYKVRFGKSHKYCDLISRRDVRSALNVLPWCCFSSNYTQDLMYLMVQKRKHLKEDDVKQLEELFSKELV